MKPAFLACLITLLISGCGMDGPAPQEAKESAKSSASSARIVPKAASAVSNKTVELPKDTVSPRVVAKSITQENTRPALSEASPSAAVKRTEEPALRAPEAERNAPRVILDQAENTAAGIPWTKDIALTKPGTVNFHVTSQGRFAVTIVTDKAYQAFQRSDEKALTNKQDVLYMAESQGFEMDGKVKLPSGTWWFIIENRSDAAVDFHLKCSLGE